MSLVGKLVSEFEINTPAQKFYKIFRDQIPLLPKISPNNIQSVEVHGGDWSNHGHGSIKVWNYTADGKAEVFKDQVEYDDEKLEVTLIGLEGNVFEYYKTFKPTFQAVPKGLEHSLAVLTLEYEKLNDGSPYPYKYLDIMTKITKDVVSYIKK